jgi:hypothetical protein
MKKIYASAKTIKHMRRSYRLFSERTRAVELAADMNRLFDTNEFMPVSVLEPNTDKLIGYGMISTMVVCIDTE